MGKKQPTLSIETRDDADLALQRIGELQRFICCSSDEAGEKIADIRAQLLKDTQTASQALTENETALKTWAKTDLRTWSGKTLNLVWGWIAWRTPPPKIVVKLEDETVIERLRARKMLTCIRVKEEVDKEALENYSDEIIEAVGCERKQGKDKFYYECKKEDVK